MKKLKLWNGRPYGVLHQNKCKDAHIYIAAYSVADACRVCVEAGQSDPGRHEIAKYFSPVWGLRMENVIPVRGVWVVYGWDGIPQLLKARTDPAPVEAS